MLETLIAEMESVQGVCPFIIEMIKAVGDEITPITHHAMKIRFERKSSVVSSKSIIINCYKTKRDPHSRDNYHGLVTV